MRKAKNSELEDKLADEVSKRIQLEQKFDFVSHELIQERIQSTQALTNVFFACQILTPILLYFAVDEGGRY